MEKSAFDIALNYAIFSYLLMAVIALLTALVIRGIVLVLAASKKRASPAATTPVVVSVTPARDEGAAIAAAIAAAVYAVIGAHRLVYIGEAQRGAGWAAETRARLHASHTPRGQR